jgi:hypothetical protein
MRCIGLLLLGFAWVSGTAGCGNAEAAPALVRPHPMSRLPLTPASRRRVVHACGHPTHVSATVGGKYAGRILRLHVPRDCAAYGSFHDYGPYGATSYAGQSNIPAAYWVYHYPYWYVYQRQIAKGPSPVSGGAYCRAPATTSANANGKYRVLARRLHVPGDCATYGSFKDYGPYMATHYAGHANLPAGYWVYRYPYWYLWQTVRP